jgi:hypothetical protein
MNFMQNTSKINFMKPTYRAANEVKDLPSKLQEIVNKNRSTPFLLNPYFRIQKNEEESQKKYRNLNNGKSIKIRKFKIILGLPNSIIRIMAFSVGSLFYVNQVNLFKSAKFDVENLFVSHATKTNINEGSDLFFGDLLKLFSEKKCTVLYLNHTRSEYAKILSKLNDKRISQNVLLMPKFLHPSETKDYLGTMIKLLKAHLKLANSYKKIEKIKADILIESIPWIFSRETYNNFNLIKRAIELQKVHQFKNLFLTLEGYSYEELISSKLKRMNMKTNLYFYQHSPLTKAHTGVQLFLKNFNEKICILTTGVAYSDFLQGFSGENEVICVGSMKALKSNKIYDESKNSVLITPEGTTTQTFKFLQLTSQIAKVHPNILFIFRFHPNLVLNRPIKKLKKSLESFDNVEISTQSLERDISRTKATMYTGSAVAIQALNYRNLPIFVDFEDCFEKDVFSIGAFNYPSINPLNYEKELPVILEKLNDSKFYCFDAKPLYQEFKIPQELGDLFTA